MILDTIQPDVRNNYSPGQPFDQADAPVDPYYPTPNPYPTLPYPPLGTHHPHAGYGPPLAIQQHSKCFLQFTFCYGKLATFWQPQVKLQRRKK